MKIIRFWNATTVVMILVLLILASCEHGSYSGSLAYLEKIGDVEMESKKHTFTNGFGDDVTTTNYTVYYFDTNNTIETEEAQCLGKLAQRYTVFYNLPADVHQ